MTELLYLQDSYLKEFYAKVIQLIWKENKKYVILDKTVFYPCGGGQPSDKGYLEYNEKNIEVIEVTKKPSTLHKISQQIPEGTEVKGIIDWDLRYIHMRMHTAQHILSRIILNEFGGRTIENQIHVDSSQMDFYPISLSDKDLILIEKNANEIIQKEIPVRIYNEKRAEIEKINEGRSNLELIPKHIDPLRVVDIENFDICPCAGTHVKNTKEIKEIRILGKENTGKNQVRLSFTLN